MSTPETLRIAFSLNGRPVETQVPVGMTVLEMVRRNFMLTATKEGCGKGECGACTILFNGLPLNSCLKLASTLRPADSVWTLEGLERDPLMTRVQKSYVEEGAVQCGFCIPGMVLSSYHLLKHNPAPSPEQIREALSGNICRCTGYTKIEQAVARAAREGKEG